MPRKLTTEEFIEKAKQIHPEYNYEKFNYIGSLTKGQVICSIHGNFYIKPNTLLNGSGCPKCGRISSTKTRTYTTEDFIKKAKKISPYYNYSKVNYINNHTKIIVGCSKHGDFLISPADIIKGRGCKKCSLEKRSDTNEEFIKKLKDLYPDYNYNKTHYTSTKHPITITCPKHGDFTSWPYNILHPHSPHPIPCHKCRIEYRKTPQFKSSLTNKRKLTDKEFIKRAKKLFPNYDYSKVNYINSHTKVTLTCPTHGEFYITPTSLLHGSGCVKCGHDKTTIKQTYTPEKFISLAKEIFPNYDYSKINYTLAKNYIYPICPKHGRFKIIGNNLLRGHGCPICKEPKGESKIRKKLDTLNIKFIRQYRFKELGSCSYDFYLPSYNLLIEYNGVQHYKEIEFFHRKPGDFQHQLERDQHKKDYAEKNGYNLLVIPYTEFNNIESILEKNILSSQK